MGMFDEIRVEQLLPGNTEITDEWFQTKSFENVMTKYVITAKGELYEERWDYVWVDDPGAVHKIFKGYLKKVEGSYRREYLTNYHGDVIFYKGMNSNKVLRDYYARFTDGKLTSMWYVDTQY
jgi:glutamate synthase domain-containing protein 1